MFRKNSNLVYFNPRSREGSDRTGWHIRTETYHFNPRSREGSDNPFLLSKDPQYEISIHAPVKGATQPCRSAAACQPAFQSTLP